MCPSENAGSRILLFHVSSICVELGFNISVETSLEDVCLCIQVNLVPSDVVLRDVEAVGNGAAYACGDRGFVIHTADYGVTWVTMDTSVASGRTLQALSCPAAEYCWVVGDMSSSILHTSDTGSTWVLQTATDLDWQVGT